MPVPQAPGHYTADSWLGATTGAGGDHPTFTRRLTARRHPHNGTEAQSRDDWTCQTGTPVEARYDIISMRYRAFEFRDAQKRPRPWISTTADSRTLTRTLNSTHLPRLVPMRRTRHIPFPTRQ